MRVLSDDVYVEAAKIFLPFINAGSLSHQTLWNNERGLEFHGRFWMHVGVHLRVGSSIGFGEILGCSRCMDRREGERDYNETEQQPVSACVRKKSRSTRKEAVSLSRRKTKRVIKPMLEDSHTCYHMKETCSLRRERSSLCVRAWEGWQLKIRTGGFWYGF